jgi:hypothetical protein
MIQEEKERRYRLQAEMDLARENSVDQTVTSIQKEIGLPIDKESLIRRHLDSSNADVIRLFSCAALSTILIDHPEILRELCSWPTRRSPAKQLRKERN